jgi:hypothetical protein
VRWHAGAKLECAQLLVGQGWARECVVLAALEHRPAQADEFAGGRDDRDLHPASGADPFKERAQWPWGAGCGERRFDEHPARVRAALLGDPPVAGWLLAGLPHPRV